MEAQTKLFENKKIWGLNQTQLKFIAILSMLVDHLVYGIFEVGLYQNIISAANITIGGSYVTGEMMDKIHFFGRIVIGRVAFPLFCFFIVQGFMHTRNRMKYALRLFIFAFISEVPFDLVSSNTIFDPNYQNVFFTLFLVLMYLYNGERGKGFKYFFYAFYPVHLLLIYFLRMYIAKNPIAIF